MSGYCNLDSNKKGQTSIELIISLGFLILTFAIIVILAYDKTSESAEIKVYMDVKRIGESIKDNINTVSEQGPGYYKYFSIPSRIRGFYDYNVSIYGNMLHISWDHRLSPYTTHLISANVTLLELEKGANNRNCIMNDNGLIKIKQICGKVSILAYEGSDGSDSTLLDSISQDCKLHVDITSDVQDIRINNLRKYDILWLGYKSVSGISYTLDVAAEDAIKQYVQEGGYVVSSLQDSASWNSDWLPGNINLYTALDEDIDETVNAGSLFQYPNNINPDALVTGGQYTGWSTDYTSLGIKEGNMSIAHFIQADFGSYGSGQYLLTTMIVRSDIPEYDANNTIQFINSISFIEPDSKC